MEYFVVCSVAVENVCLFTDLIRMDFVFFFWQDDFLPRTATPLEDVFKSILWWSSGISLFVVFVFSISFMQSPLNTLIWFFELTHVRPIVVQKCTHLTWLNNSLQFAMPAMSKMHDRHMHTRTCHVERSKEALRTGSDLSYRGEKTVQVLQLTDSVALPFRNLTSCPFFVLWYSSWFLDELRSNDCSNTFLNCSVYTHLYVTYSCILIHMIVVIHVYYLAWRKMLFIYHNLYFYWTKIILIFAEYTSRESVNTAVIWEWLMILNLFSLFSSLEDVIFYITANYSKLFRYGSTSTYLYVFPARVKIFARISQNNPFTYMHISSIIHDLRMLKWKGIYTNTISFKSTAANWAL